ncbi:MAG TPA: flagellar assembly protein FliX [Asticcacaulis sp.]
MTIRINSPLGAAQAGAGGAVRKGGGEGFSLSGASGASKSAGPAQASAAVGMLGVDALLAIQSEDDVMTGRRRRQVRRSKDILDALDDLRISVLSGDIDDEALLRLQGLIALHREDVADDRLQGVLNEIETRACVELAKRRLI